MNLRRIAVFCSVLAVCLYLAAAPAPNVISSLKSGKAELKSAGPLAFAPEGILLAGDPMGAQIFAFDTQDRSAPSSAAPVEVKAVNEKIAAMLGTTPDQVLVNDVAVNPISRKVYLSVSRGKGPDATAVILRADQSGKLEEFALDNVKHSRVSLPNAPDAAQKDRSGVSRRMEAITDLAYVDGKVVVAGLSNEEFASQLRAIPFPFQDSVKAASVEIYHGSHGRFETNAPVRTFVPYQIKSRPHILAAYTCTPLVVFPVSDLQPGKKVKGMTIAELGNRNRPLDMIVYQKDGKDFILLNNSSRGVMKLPAANLDSYPAITAQAEIKGVPYETIADLKGVQHLDKLDARNALLLVQSGAGSLDLRTVALP